MNAPLRERSSVEQEAARATPSRPPLLERYALGLFRREGRKFPPLESLDAVHVLNEDERRALKALSRGAILRAALAGGLSALAAAVAEHLADPLLGAEGSDVPWESLLQFWSIVGGITVVASIFEIAYLYRDSLKSVHALSRAAGLPLFEGEEARAVAAALARAALELPNPTEHLLGVDPRREASRGRLIAASLLYKLKVAASNFVAKLFLRKLLGRLIVRSTLAFVAVPVTAIWNGVVAWWVLREARFRAMGPSAIEEALGHLLPPGLTLSPRGREAVVRSVAASIVRTHDLHPNLRALLLEVHERLGATTYERLDDPARYLALLRTLADSEQQLSLRLLGFAAIVDGRLTRDEARLFREARLVCGLEPTCPALQALRREYVNGDGLSAERLDQLSSSSSFGSVSNPTSVTTVT